MLADAMYPKGWHFIRGEYYAPGDITTTKAPLELAPYIPRTLASPVYTFIDFGNSQIYAEGQLPYYDEKYGSLYPPEMSSDRIIQNTFAVDIWCFAQTWRSILADQPVSLLNLSVFSLGYDFQLRFTGFFGHI